VGGDLNTTNFIAFPLSPLLSETQKFTGRHCEFYKCTPHIHTQWPEFAKLSAKKVNVKFALKEAMKAQRGV
jgi:hypothetical protein